MKTQIFEKLKSQHKKIFIGVSWPYANGDIHLGHLAGQNVVCDVFARYHRLIGNEVLMVSGSDCHGAPVVFAAEEKGIKPEEFAEKSHENILKTFKRLGFLYENYTSTTTENHKKVAQNVFLVLKEKGYLVEKESQQYFDPKVNRFLPDRYVRGTCPNCKADNARGDECPECGAYLDPEELINPRSTLSDATPIIKQTNHFYLDLRKAAPKLNEWLKDKNYWRKWVLEVSRGWIKNGLKPRAITRDMDYGIKVPVDGWEGKVIYVWFEAVIGYLSAAIEWAAKQGNPGKWEEFWKNSECKHYYFIAGGNVPFHTIIWPAEIFAYNEKYEDKAIFEKYKLPGETTQENLQLPYDVPANNMLTFRGKKMSKGDKTGITLQKLLDEYKFNPDTLRYFFVKNAPEDTNRDYISKDLVDSNNNELVANIGNFINRVVSFTNSKFEGIVPEGHVNNETETQLNETFIKTGKYIEECEFVKAIEQILALGHYANKYFNDQKPWEKIKTEQENASNTIYNSIQIVSAFGTLLKPFLPFTAEKIQKMLNFNELYDPNKELESNGKISKFVNVWKFNEIPVGQKINKPEILFEKLDYREEFQKTDNPEPEIIISTETSGLDFSKIDPNVVIAKIKSSQPHPKDAKLKIHEVESRSPSRVVCAAQNVNPGDIVPLALPGSKVLSLSGKGKHKIESATIKGEKSEGMLCAQVELGIGQDTKNIYILPKSFEKHIGKPLSSIRSIGLNIDETLKDEPVLWTVVRDINIKRNRSNKLNKWIHDRELEVEQITKNKKWKENEIYSHFRELHSKYGAGDTPGAAEELISFVNKNHALPNINNFVDLYNTFSATTGISIGAHDIERIDGTPQLKILEKDQEFNHVTTNTKDVAKKGEYAFTDDKGVMCRLDIKQSNHTNVTQKTKKILIIFQGTKTLTIKVLKEKLKEFEKLVKELL
ncbi:methionine--tRNA ligase [Candidatus Dojkabacteria bacterium]|nr:methionine--tRNA ligase [Candidatus Dojkabacteria bacterium]